MQSAIESAVDTSDPAARLTARFAARSRGLRRPSSSRSSTIRTFERLRGDAQFWNDVEEGNLDAALRSAAASRRSRTMRSCGRRLAHLGLVSDEAAHDADQFRQSIAQVARADRAAPARAAQRPRRAGSARRPRGGRDARAGRHARVARAPEVSRAREPVTARRRSREGELEEREIRVGRVGRDLAGQADQLEARRLVAGLRRRRARGGRPGSGRCSAIA